MKRPQLSEARRLLRIRVRYDGRAFTFQTPDEVKVYNGSPEGLQRFLQKIQAKDTETSPASQRGKTYLDMVQGILDGTDNEIWVWSTDFERYPLSIHEAQEDRMPSPYIKKLSKETGKSEVELEKLWKKAKTITSETFGVDEANFGEREYSYTVGVIKNMIGQNEAVLNPSFFLRSGLSATEFIEAVASGEITEAMISGQINIGTVYPPKKKRPEEEEKTEEDSDLVDFTKESMEEEGEVDSAT